MSKKLFFKSWLEPACVLHSQHHIFAACEISPLVMNGTLFETFASFCITTVSKHTFQSKPWIQTDASSTDLEGTEGVLNRFYEDVRLIDFNLKKTAI